MDEGGELHHAQHHRRLHPPYRPYGSCRCHGRRGVLLQLRLPCQRQGPLRSAAREGHGGGEARSARSLTTLQWEVKKFGDILAKGMERLEKIWKKLEKNEDILKHRMIHLQRSDAVLISAFFPASVWAAPTLQPSWEDILGSKHATFFLDLHQPYLPRNFHQDKGWGFVTSEEITSLFFGKAQKPKKQPGRWGAFWKRRGALLGKDIQTSRYSFPKSIHNFRCAGKGTKWSWSNWHCLLTFWPAGRISFCIANSWMTLVWSPKAVFKQSAFTVHIFTDFNQLFLVSSPPFKWWILSA